MTPELENFILANVTPIPGSGVEMAKKGAGDEPQPVPGP